jgi:hypothetical protein
MPQAHSQQSDRYAQLYAKYRFEWRAFAQETRRWRLLKEEGQSKPGSVRKAESRAESAQDRYRRARNELWEHIVKHSTMRSLVAY